MTPYFFYAICHPKPVIFFNFISKLIISNDSVHTLFFFKVRNSISLVASMGLEQLSLERPKITLSPNAPIILEQNAVSHPMTPHLFYSFNLFSHLIPLGGKTGALHLYPFHMWVPPTGFLWKKKDVKNKRIQKYWAHDLKPKFKEDSRNVPDAWKPCIAVRSAKHNIGIFIVLHVEKLCQDKWYLACVNPSHDNCKCLSLFQRQCIFFLTNIAPKDLSSSDGFAGFHCHIQFTDIVVTFNLIDTHMFLFLYFKWFN